MTTHSWGSTISLWNPTSQPLPWAAPIWSEGCLSDPFKTMWVAYGSAYVKQPSPAMIFSVILGKWLAAGGGKVPVYEDGKKTPVSLEDLEFDVVAEDQYDKHTILVGECKWNGTDYADRLLVKLKKKVSMAPFAQDKKVVYALFLRERPLSLADCDILLPEDVLLQLPE